jgi:uncharacterized protein YutE (UPF0331/DUF86 family)
LQKLRELQKKSRQEFERDAFLRDIVERNLEVAIQCCLDICQRIIALQQAASPDDYYGAVLKMGELGVLPPEFARKIAPMTGFRNVLVHEYVGIDWDQVYAVLQNLGDLEQFAEYVTAWRARPAAS